MTKYKTVPKLIDLSGAKWVTAPRLKSIYIPSKRWGGITTESPLQKYAKEIRLSEVRASEQTEQREMKRMTNWERQSINETAKSLLIRLTTYEEFPWATGDADGQRLLVVSDGT